VKLADLLGDSAVVRVLAVLASKPTRLWSRSLLASKASLDPRTVRRVLSRLRGLDVVRFDAEFGVLGVNVNNPLTEALLAFYQAVAAYEAPKRAAEA